MAIAPQRIAMTLHGIAIKSQELNNRLVPKSFIYFSPVIHG